MSENVNRILIVEDDPGTRKLLKVTLERLGECHECSNGAEALEYIATSHKNSKPYHLICLDIMMPEIDGHEVLKRCRELEAENNLERSQIVMVTGKDDKETILGTFKDGCEAYLAKPVDLKKLKDVLKKLGFLREN